MSELQLTEVISTLLAAIGTDLGTYKRSGHPDAPAVWVLDEPFPKGVEVFVSPPDVPPVAALEVVVLWPPEVQQLPARNFGESKRILHGWRIWVVIHDSRQEVTGLVKRIGASFPETMEEPVLNQRPRPGVDFYTLKIWAAPKNS
jgi:hypothetical protein